MAQSTYPYDPDLHDAGGPAAQGECSHHAQEGGECAGPAVVSFQDDDGNLQSGCSLALEQLVERGTIEALGQGG